MNLFTGLKGQGLRRREAMNNPQHPANWQEDYDHENGQYENRCVSCTRHFIGHKRRGVCKICTLSTGLNHRDLIVFETPASYHSEDSVFGFLNSWYETARRQPDVIVRFESLLPILNAFSDWPTIADHFKHLPPTAVLWPFRRDRGKFGILYEFAEELTP